MVYHNTIKPCSCVRVLFTWYSLSQKSLCFVSSGNVSSIQRTSTLNTPSSDSQQQSTSGIQHDSASDSQSIALPDSADIDLVTDSLPESPARPRSAYSEAESDDSLFTRPPTPSTPLNTALISQRPGTSDRSVLQKQHQRSVSYPSLVRMHLSSQYWTKLRRSLISSSKLSNSRLMMPMLLLGGRSLGN